MNVYYVYERVYTIYDSQDERRGYVEARDEKSAYNKAKKKFKYVRYGGEYGAFTRRVIPENLFLVKGE